jgi:hypothetical protein
MAVSFFTFCHTFWFYIVSASFPLGTKLCTVAPSTGTVELLLSGLRLTVPLKKIRKSNCAETLLELLEQESDSNFSYILTLRKLSTSIKLKRSKKTKQRFLTDFFKKDSRQTYVRQKIKTPGLLFKIDNGL